MCTFRRLLLSLLVAASTACGVRDDSAVIRAPNHAHARAVNQLAVSGNACGPAALLNSMRFADTKWRKPIERFEGETDRAQLMFVIRRYGMRPSPHLGGRPRWNHRGVNLLDLTDIANEVTSPHGLPKLRHEVLSTGTAEDPVRQLARTHRLITRSMAKGFPPLLSVRRFVMRDGTWVVVDAHFITLTGVPRRLQRGAESFAIQYIDPWGAAHREGRIQLGNDDSAGFPIADLPMANVGKSRLRDGEATFLAASAVIGSF